MSTHTHLERYSPKCQLGLSQGKEIWGESYSVYIFMYYSEFLNEQINTIRQRNRRYTTEILPFLGSLP